jgi:hypothetical protein
LAKTLLFSASFIYSLSLFVSSSHSAIQKELNHFASFLQNYRKKIKQQIEGILISNPNPCVLVILKHRMFRNNLAVKIEFSDNISRKTRVFKTCRFRQNCREQNRCLIVEKCREQKVDTFQHVVSQNV